MGSLFLLGASSAALAAGAAGAAAAQAEAGAGVLLPPPADFFALGLAVVNATSAAAAGAISQGRSVGAVVAAGMGVLASVAASNTAAGGGGGGGEGGSSPGVDSFATTLLVAAEALLNASTTAGAQLSPETAAATLSLLGAINAGGGGGDAAGGGDRSSAPVLVALAAAALSSPSAASGTPLSFTSAPRSTPNTPLCAPAVALTVFRVPVGSVESSRGGNWSISIGSPLPFCNASVALPEVGGSLPARPLQLPPSLVAAQPPPTLTLSYATLAWLTRAGGPVAPVGAAAVDFRLVQWGAAPMPEGAGVGGIVYPPAVEAGAPVDSGGGRWRRRRAAAAAARELGLFSSFSSFFSPAAWADMVSSAFSATRTALDAVAPPPPRVDRLPSRPLDSRVFTIEVSSGSGAPVALASLPGGPPGGFFYITVPLRDLSIVNYGPKGAGGVEIGQSLIAPSPVINATCPLAARVGAAVPALNVATRPPAPVRVVVVSTGAVPVVAPGIDVGEPDGALGADGLVGSDGGAALSAVVDGGGLGGNNAVANAPTFLLSADCGAPYGNRTFACGPGMGGTTVTYACPRAAPAPSCLYYDKPSKKWTTAGCSVARVDLTSIICACDALRDFGMRYAALDDAPLRVFVSAAPTVRTSLFPAAALLYAAMGVVLCCMGACGVVGCGGRKNAQAAILEAMRADGEVVLLRLLRSWEEREVGGAAVAPIPPPIPASDGKAKNNRAPPPGARGALLLRAREWLAAGVVAAPPLCGAPQGGVGAPLRLRPWADALRAAAAASAAAAAHAPPSAERPYIAPTVSEVVALAGARLRAGAHGPALSHFASLPTLCRGHAAGGDGAALLGHSLLLCIAVTAALYAKVFGAASTAVVSLRPPLAPISGGVLLSLSLTAAVALGVVLGALQWARAASAAAALRERFPALAEEDARRASFAAAVRNAGEDWGALREGALRRRGGALGGEGGAASRVFARLAPHVGALATWAASAFSVYYAATFGARNGAAPSNALVGAASLAAALRLLVAQPAWAVADAAAALVWRGRAPLSVAGAPVPPLAPALAARAAVAYAAAAALTPASEEDAALSGGAWGWLEGPFRLLLHVATGEPLLTQPPRGAEGPMCLPSLYLAMRLETLLADGVELLEEAPVEQAPQPPPPPPPPVTALSAPFAAKDVDAGADTRVGGDGSEGTHHPTGGGDTVGASDPATHSRSSSAPTLRGAAPPLNFLSAAIAGAPRLPLRPLASVGGVALMLPRGAPLPPTLRPALPRSQQLWAERIRFEGGRPLAGGGARPAAAPDSPPPSALRAAGGAALLFRPPPPTRPATWATGRPRAPALASPLPAVAPAPAARVPAAPPPFLERHYHV
jgi:hypothetical protein